MEINLILLIGPTISALLLLAVPGWQRQRIEARMRAGDDRFLDEQWSYRSYPWLRDPTVLRGIGLTILGLEAIYLGLVWLG
ncbi:hypothetical protein CHU95_00150 [Niveispirillum lacus]|uniref:Uncharacterized protein n=1 Tax=Niveispirillum lacus TaxID=1981099 RepID=A0A255Z8N8_9PROT|nr:hypothetical protein [Niveispirillum lacus]OYQ37917.1 hypothetical protein CHU95_00150 [Niveispirillum lacus]